MRGCHLLGAVQHHCDLQPEIPRKNQAWPPVICASWLFRFNSSQSRMSRCSEVMAGKNHSDVFIFFEGMTSFESLHSLQYNTTNVVFLTQISDDVQWWILGHRRRIWPFIFTAENYKLLVPHFLCGERSRTSHRTSTVNAERRRRFSSCSHVTSPAWQWEWGAPAGVNWWFWCKQCSAIETEIEYLCYSKHQWSFFSWRYCWITLRSIWTKGWWRHISGLWK